MAFNDAMMHDTVWFERPKYEEEIANYQRFLSGHAVAAATASTAAASDSGSTLLNQIKEARSHIKQSLGAAPAAAVAKKAPAAAKPAASVVDTAGMKALELENADLKKLVAELTSRLSQLEVRVGKVEEGQAPAAPAATPAQAAAKPAEKKPAPKEEEDSDSDPFRMDDDDDEEDEDDDEEETPAQKAHREKMEAAAKKKADEKKAKGKAPVVGKSEVTLDVKPWDDETDMAKLEECVRTVAMEGLLWGQSKLVPVGFGIKKLQIRCVVVDDLVSTDDVQEQIEAFDDYCQSTDIAAFNKI